MGRWRSRSRRRWTSFTGLARPSRAGRESAVHTPAGRTGDAGPRPATGAARVLRRRGGRFNDWAELTNYYRDFFLTRRSVTATILPIHQLTRKGHDVAQCLSLRRPGAGSFERTGTLIRRSSRARHHADLGHWSYSRTGGGTRRRSAAVPGRGPGRRARALRPGPAVWSAGPCRGVPVERTTIGFRTEFR